MRIGTYLLAFLLLGGGNAMAQKERKLDPFVEYGATVHTGDNTPLWQMSNLQGLASLDNSTYIRGGVFYHDQWGKWKVNGGLDLVRPQDSTRASSRLTLTSATNGSAFLPAARR